MKSFLLALVTLLLTNYCFAQHVYSIRADTVRIYNDCDTAELVLENRTKDTLGFLYNKGKGRTEFRKLQLEKIEDNKLAITGQDTLDFSPGIVTATAPITYNSTTGVIGINPATTTTDGTVTSIAQTFAGRKSFEDTSIIAYTTAGSGAFPYAGIAVTNKSSVTGSGSFLKLSAGAINRYGYIGAVDNMGSPGQFSAGLVFGIQQPNGTWAERMRIASNGDIIMGTLTGSRPVLTVTGGISTTSMGLYSMLVDSISVSRRIYANGDSLSLSGSYNDKSFSKPGGEITLISGSSPSADAGIIRFHSGTGTGAKQPERMRIDASGNVIVNPATNAIILGNNGTITSSGSASCLGMMNTGQYTGNVRIDAGTTVTVGVNDETIVCTGAAAVTVNLPAVSANGRRITIKRSGVGTVTLDPAGAEQMEGVDSGTKVITVNLSSVTVQAIGTSWWIVSAYAGNTTL